MKSNIKSTENIISDITKTKMSLFNNENYILWKIKKNWINITGEEIGGKSFPKYLYNKKMTLNAEDSIIHHSILVHAGLIIEKINDFIQKEAVNELEIRKIEKKPRRNIVKNLTEINEENSEISDEEPNEKTDFEENIELSAFETGKIKKSISKIDKKYKNIAEKLEKIALNRKKKDIYLLSKGYIRCKDCGDIFYPSGKNEICPYCCEKEENEKLEKMSAIIMGNPFIGENEAVKISGTDRYTYYKVRDILAQRAYNDLLYFYITKNIEIKYSEDYESEIRKEANTDFEIYVKNYIDCKVGTDNKEIYNIERKKVIAGLRKKKEYQKR